ncbi:leucine-rich repeat-containing protein 26 [Spea bombifrons]|uniref:leucine-rich repeat-containing protein 26 n=1 Tax=Spea bombifrons TaxID=233779 RepID=UPI00234AC833|nr:leucine-rich repeat-containing protein 26 [Spea bombifrons]
MKPFVRKWFFLTVLALKSLYVSGCPDVCNCSRGQTDCRGKLFHFVPENLDEDTDTLILADNNLSGLRSLAFSRCPNLVHLDLSNNMIEDISRHAFQHLHHLAHLDLSGNHLTSISPEVFTPLSGLTTLNLGNNMISTLSGSTLEALVRLQSLYLHNNILVGLNWRLLKNAPSLRELRLDGNPWDCNCQIQNLLSWMVENASKMKENERTLCETPKPLDRFPVMEITQEWFRGCWNFTPDKYPYILLVGLALCFCSVLLCYATAFLVVFYKRHQARNDQKPHVFKKKPLLVGDSIVIANHSQVSAI